MRFSALFAATALAASSALAATTCNGDASLCDKLYSNVTFIGAHDSYAVGTGSFDNQDKDVTSQLNDGVRALQVQTHDNNGTIHVCHTSCSFLDGGSLESYLTSVATWIAANPNDVVTLVMVNSDNLAATEFATVFESAGLSNKSYSPSASYLPISEWPTLGNLIDNGTTLVTFMDNTADFSTVPYIIDEFTNIWEDAYDVTDQTWGCAINRTSSSVSSSTQMYMINHFLDSYTSLLGVSIFTPNTAKLNETNAATGTGSIGFHVDNCIMLYGRYPNIILLDYYDSNGNAPFDAVATMNGVSAPTNTVTAGAITGVASSTGTSSDGMESTSSLKSYAAKLPAGALASVFAAALSVVVGAALV